MCLSFPLGRTSRRAAVDLSTLRPAPNASFFPASSTRALSWLWKTVGCILKEGKAKKLVQEVAHVTFSGKRAMALGQQVLYVTERCVIELTERGLVVTEVAPGIDPERDILAQSDAVLHLSDNLKLMHESYFSQGEHHE